MNRVQVKTPAPRWEYYIHATKVKGGIFSEKKMDEGLATELNSLGRSGWELVSVLDLARGQGESDKFVLLFKRRID